MFIVICKCGKKVGMPRPGSVDKVKGAEEVEDAEEDTEIVDNCPFCNRKISSKDGFEVAEPPVEVEEFDLLKVD